MKKFKSGFIALALICSLGISNFASATVILKTGAYSVDSLSQKSFSIKNLSDNALTVTYSGYPYSDTQVAIVTIYDSNTYSSSHKVESASFNPTQKHTETFKLPSNKTYYAVVSTTSNTSVDGMFKATY